MAEAKGEIWRPSPEQELLVRAATEDGDRAREAWEKWIASVEIEKIDVNSQRILPLLYHNLQRLEIQHKEMNRFGLHYRATWARNQVGLRNLEIVIKELEAHGIKSLLLKGVAMILCFYKDAGLRPLSDFDFLVPEQQAEEAIELLFGLGWGNSSDSRLLKQNYRKPLHAVNLTMNGKILGCDIHWHVTSLHLAARYDAPMWKDAVPIRIGHVQTLVLSNEDHLIHILFHARLNEGETKLRWLTDAFAIIKSEEGVNWSRFEGRCQLMEMGQPFAEMLAYLRNEWNMDVPVETIRTLENTYVSYTMKKAYESLSMAAEERTIFHSFWHLYAQYRQSHPQAIVPSLGFVRYLGYRWRLDGGVRGVTTYIYLRLRGVNHWRAQEIAGRLDIKVEI